MVVVRLALVVAAVVVAPAFARADPVRASAMRRDGPIVVDGRLDDDVWTRAPKHGGFVQRFPQDGGKASVETRFAIVYDDDAIYVGVWCDDPEPQLIRALLTRRDIDSPSDTIILGFDSYHDKRTAYAFQLNAANVQRDFLVFDDANTDDTWDAVWTSGTAITPSGWTAEVRIPLGQLRFRAGDDQEWGFQIARQVGRTQELVTWSPWPRAAPQIVSKFGVVGGFDHLRQRRRLELLPYVLGGIDVKDVDAGDPLNKSVSPRGGIGLDLKYGLGPAFTLSATINPDFGQVEADPSLVNLSPNETYYPEKRPFFLEGVDLFRLPIGIGGNQIENVFYSRRIGGAPPNMPSDYSYIDWPTSTTIFGAAKLTGKQDGWSVGVLEAVTGPADASIIDTAGARTDEQVAPLTSYTVARVKRDLRGGQTTIGISASAVERALDDPFLVDTLPDQAYTAGAQLQHRFGDNAWQLDARVVGSFIHGSQPAITFEQELNRHLFQRPDATDVHLDPTRTELDGLGATWIFGRNGETKHWRIETGGDLRTPGLELNDLGFQQNSDHVIPYVWSQWHHDDPSPNILNWQINSDVYIASNFEPTLLGYGFDSNASAQTVDYWNLWANLNGSAAGFDPQAMRGGPMLRTDPTFHASAGLSTDTRKKLRIDAFGNLGRNPTQDEIDGQFGLAATIQARPNLDIFIGPNVYRRDDPMQYVTQVYDGNGRLHFIFGHILQTTLTATIRVNWTFSPHLSLQIYAQPFIGAGRYTELKDVDNPRAARFEDRFHLLQGSDYALVNGNYNVSYNGAYSFAQPDFDIRQLRSTIVLRWEYRPGSTVFAIWNHGRTSSDVTRYQFERDLAALVHADQENVFLVKVNYWIGL